MQLDDLKYLKIEKDKIIDYLLNLSHPDGSSKAKFFISQGFSLERWTDFAAALKQHAIVGKITKQEQTYFGSKIIVEGILQTPFGKNPLIRGVWFLEKRKVFYKLVTAYPIKQ